MKLSYSTHSREAFASLLGTAFFLFAASARGQVDSSWTLNSAGTWPTPANWTAGIPDETGAAARFVLDITANRTISLNGNRRVGVLEMGDPSTSPFAFSINSGGTAVLSVSSLIFDAPGAGPAQITARGGSNGIISSNVTLADDLDLGTPVGNTTTTHLSISAVILESGGAKSLSKSGPGIAQLAAHNSFSGGTTIGAGRLNNNALFALGVGSATVLSGGQLFLNTSSTAASATIAGTGYTNTTDSAAAAGAIRFANNRNLFGGLTVAGSSRIGGATTEAGTILGPLSGGGNLEINGPTTTTGSIRLVGSGATYTGTISLARGSFIFDQSLGGNLTAAPAGGATSTLGLGTGVAGNVTFDSTAATLTARNTKGPLAIGGTLTLAGATTINPATFAAPGTTAIHVLTYGALAGAGSLTFDNAGFRGSPVIAAGPAAATISGLDLRSLSWAGAFAGDVWDAGVSPVWSGGDTKFQNGDSVSFGEGDMRDIEVSGTVKPHAVVFDSGIGYNYTILGSGTIDAAGGGIFKRGPSTLTIGGTHTFTGPVAVEGGRLVLNSASALGFTGGVTVAGGAALDLNGQRPLTANRQVDLVLSGNGDGSVPALTNTGANIAFTGGPVSGIRDISLAADTTIGGASGKDFDISGRITGNGHTLTKIGANTVWLLGPAEGLDTHVQEGVLAASGDCFGDTLRVGGTATARAATAGEYRSDISIDSGGKLELFTGSYVLFSGQIDPEGDMEMVNNNTGTTNLILSDSFSIPGRLTISGTGSSRLLGDVTLDGNLVLSGALLIGSGATTNTFLVNGGGSTGAGTLTVDAGSTLGGTGYASGAVVINPGAFLNPGPAGGIGTLATGLASPARPTNLNGTLRIDYNGAAAVPVDRLQTNGALAIGAGAVLQFNALGPPLAGIVHVVANFPSSTGSFSTAGLPAGYSLVHAANSIYLMESSYAAVMASAFPGVTDLAIIGPSADPDGDGNPNAMETYFGTNPSLASSRPGLVATGVAGPVFTFTHSIADAPPSGFTPAYEWSVDLTNWHDSGESAGGTTVVISSSLQTDNPSPQNDVMGVTATVTAGTAPELFVRFKGTLP